VRGAGGAGPRTKNSGKVGLSQGGQFPKKRDGKWGRKEETKRLPSRGDTSREKPQKKLKPQRQVFELWGAFVCCSLAFSRAHVFDFLFPPPKFVGN